MKRLSMAMTALAVLGLMTMVSCRKPNVNNAIPGTPRTVTFNATTESGNGSKTTLEGLYVKWSADDQIKVNDQTLTLASGAGTTSCTFTGEVSGTEFYAGYPVSAVSYTAPSTLSVNIPAEMEYDAGNPTEGLVRMVAHTTSSGDNAMLNFKNAVNVLKLQLKGVDTDASNLKSIVLKSSTSNLHGNIAVTFSGATPTFGYADGSNTSTVTFGSGLQLKSDETKYVYILLPRINGGELIIRFNCSNGNYMSKKITVTSDFNEVNNILRAPELTVDAQTEPVSDDPSVTTNNVCDACQYKGARGYVESSTTQECEYGFVYAKKSENDNPEIGGSRCKKFCYAIGEVTSTGVTFNADLDLEAGVEYSFKAYAIGDNGNVVYGAVKTIDTPKAVNWNGGSTPGASPNVFTVASGITVRFSQGNLQYHCSSDKEWRFAEHQFDMIHTENVNVSDEYTENSGKWIDLFGWGTSGQAHGATCYQPWSTSTSNGDFYAYGAIGNNLYDGGANAGKADWGYNAIYSGVTSTTGWRTLKQEEWGYLLGSTSPCRPDAANLYGQGKVGCTNGLIILPDNWNWNATALNGMRKPDGTGDLKFTVGGSEWLNTYSYTDWSKMESLGAVFLPAAGYRSWGGWTLNNVGDDGMYWSSSCSGSYACRSRFSYTEVSPNGNSDRYYGYSVRLVKDVTSK